MSNTRAALVNAVASLQGSGGGVISVTKVHELLNKISDILDSAVSKWVGNTAHNLAFICNSASRHCSEVLASQSPILYIFKDTFPHSEACIYGHINLSLAQTQKQAISLSQASTSVRGDKAKPKTGFSFNVQKWPKPESSGTSFAKSLTWKLGLRVSCQGSRKSSGLSLHQFH